MILGYSGIAGRRLGNTVLMHHPAGHRRHLICASAAARARPPVPREPLKGITYYAVTRALQMKFMRLPKAQVKIGQKLPEQYK